MTFSLNFKYHLDQLIESVYQKCHQLILSNLPPRQALLVLQMAIKPKIMYSFPLTPFSLADITLLDGILARAARTFMRLGAGFPTRLITTSQEAGGGAGVTSLLVDYIQISALTLTRSLNDKGDLGDLSNHMLHEQLSSSGYLPIPITRRPRNVTFHSLPVMIRQLSLLHQANITIHQKDKGLQGTL